MAIILMTPELLMERAGEVRRLKIEYEQTMSKLNNLIMDLSQSWKGKSQDALVARYQGMAYTFKNFAVLLEFYAKLMDLSVRGMQDIDNDLTNIIKDS